MELNRFRFVICLSMALLVMTGIVMAGDIDSVTNVRYAREVVATSAASALYQLPAGSEIVYNMNVIRSAEDDFFVDIALGNGATFTGVGLDNSDLVMTAGGGAVTFTLQGVTTNVTKIRYWAQITSPMTTLGVISIRTAGWQIKDNSLAMTPTGGSISVSVTTFDAATNEQFDLPGDNTEPFVSTAYGLLAYNLDPTSAIIDVATNRKNFLTTKPAITDADTLLEDVGANVTVGYVPDIYGKDGLPFTLTAASDVKLVITGDMSGISEICWADVCITTTTTATGPGRIVPATNTATIVVDANSPLLNNAAQYFVITVDGETILLKRTLDVRVDLDGTTGVNDRNLLATSTLTQWTLNGTVLLTNWTNGNSSVYNGRLYIWNPSPVAGAVTVDVFTLPVGFAGSEALTPAEGLELGTLLPLSGTNIRVSDILAAAGVPLPYIDNGGNLVIQITVNAPNVVGYSNVFNNSISFGMATLQVIQ